MKRLLLLIPTTSYRTSPFLDAAKRMGVEVAVGSNLPQVLEEHSHGGTVTLDFRNLQKGTRQVLEYHRFHPLQAVVSVDDETAPLAASASAALNLPHNSLESIQATRNKFKMRKTLSGSGLLSPRYRLFTLDKNCDDFSGQVQYPCVLKPTFLAASRGVIRADSPSEFVAAFARIGKILKDPEVVSLGGDAANEILVEDFIPGAEVALEGLMIKGKVHVLALFDKPDPLDGPFFEETLYVTPSRLSSLTQNEIADTVSRATEALGLEEGPIHAELRLNPKGVWVIEIAARSIGGLCSRVLRFGTGLTLEEIILHHAMGLPVESLQRETKAAGVMMIPIPRGGVLKEVRGKAEAENISGIEEISILIPEGQEVVPLPEGHQYLGFIFARGKTPGAVESTLRQAHQRLNFVISPS